MSHAHLKLFWPNVVMAALFTSCATPLGGHASATPKNSVELYKAAYEVEDAIRYYQTYLRSQTRGLPRLTKVEFEFQTTTDVSGGLNVDLYVFTLGASAQRSTTHDVTYTYPRLPSTAEKHDKTPPYLYKELLETIKTTVEAANAAKEFGTKPFETLQVKVQYAFKITGEVGAKFPVEMVTLGINAQADKNSTQSVTLTFGSH